MLYNKTWTWFSSKKHYSLMVHRISLDDSVFYLDIRYVFKDIHLTSVHFSSVSQSCPTLCDPMNRSTPSLPVHHQLPKFTQTRVHQVCGNLLQQPLENNIGMYQAIFVFYFCPAYFFL